MIARFALAVVIAVLGGAPWGGIAPLGSAPLAMMHPGGALFGGGLIDARGVAPAPFAVIIPGGAHVGPVSFGARGVGAALDPLRIGRTVSAPPIVFVSRAPVPGAPGAVPGVGPLHRTVAVGGRLMVRGISGRITPLLEPGVFFDVADPAVSYDGRRIAFAATVARDSAWRIWTVGADGRALLPVTRTDRALDLSRFGADAARYARYDDFDPVWLPDDRIVFASTRYPEIAEAGMPASNLFVVRADGAGLLRVTSERNGAEEPSVDPRSGLLVYARWWTSRYLASESASSGITTDRARAIAADPVDLWQAIATTADGDFPRLAGGFALDRTRSMAYQPIVLDDGTLVGVTAQHTGLFPEPGILTVHAFPNGFEAPSPVPVDQNPARIVTSCAPASLGARRIVMSSDRRAQGDLGLWVASLDGGTMSLLVDLPGTHELDAAMLAPRRRPLVYPHTASPLPNDAPPTDVDVFLRGGQTFRFDCLNVFTNAPVDAPIPDAPPFQPGARIRFFAVLARPQAAGGDTAVLVRESAIQPGGAVHEDMMPSDTPMFEQLIDAHGTVLRSATGPAHVPGLNAARFGSGTKCVGCHVGHSVIPVAQSAYLGKRFNAAPSATATATSSAAGTAGPRGAVDRRTKGLPGVVAWVADGASGESLRLEWSSAIEVDSLILYALAAHPPSGTDLRVRECRLDLFLNGRAVGQQIVHSELSPRGTRVSCGGVRADAVEFRPLRSTGKVLGRERVAIAEIATVARMAED